MIQLRKLPFFSHFKKKKPVDLSIGVLVVVATCTFFTDTSMDRAKSLVHIHCNVIGLGCASFCTGFSEPTSGDPCCTCCI